MNIMQILKYQKKEYTIICSEQEFIDHPAALARDRINAATLKCSFISSFEVKDYKLLLNKILVRSDDAYNPEGAEVERELLELDEIPVSYNGAVLIGTNLVKEYYIRDESQPACFTYGVVYELIFDKGILITFVDHSRAMLRIRRNLEHGLRRLERPRDLRCILRFINSSLIGDYRPFRFNFKRLGYIKEMRKDYQTLNT